jgi:hypothetical protein
MTMTGHEELSAVAEEATQPHDGQSRLSRRTALRTAAAAGVAATALAATGAPALAAARPSGAERHGAGREDAGHGGAEHGGAEHGGTDASEPLVAHLRNARTGEIDVFHGTSQTRVHDPALAAMLMRARR